MNPIETYHRWKNIPDPRLARELAEIEKDPRQIAERFGTPLSSGAGGVRGRGGIHRLQRGKRGLRPHHLR